jgi:hypothetical protein
VPAPASAVAAWVDRLVGEKLEARAALLLQIEQVILDPIDPFEGSAPTVAEPFRAPADGRPSPPAPIASGQPSDSATHPEFQRPPRTRDEPGCSTAGTASNGDRPAIFGSSLGGSAFAESVFGAGTAAGTAVHSTPDNRRRSASRVPLEEVRSAATRIAGDRPLLKKLAIGAVLLIVVPTAARAIFRAQVGAAINEELTNRGVLLEGERQIESDRIVWKNATILVRGAGIAGTTDRFSLKATTVIVRREGRVITSVAIDAPVLELAGDPAERIGRLESWRTRFAGAWIGDDGPAIDVRVRNGKFDFRDVFGPGSDLTATFDGAITGRKLLFDLTDVRFHGVGAGPSYGPLRGTLHETNEGAALDLSLVVSPAKAVIAGQKAPPPHVVLAFAAKKPPTLALDLPPTLRTELAVPRDFFWRNFGFSDLGRDRLRHLFPHGAARPRALLAYRGASDRWPRLQWRNYVWCWKQHRHYCRRGAEFFIARS